MSRDRSFFFSLDGPQLIYASFCLEEEKKKALYKKETTACWGEYLFKVLTPPLQLRDFFSLREDRNVWRICLTRKPENEQHYPAPTP